jgi:hypothetical protein
MRRPEQEMQKAMASYLYGRQAYIKDLVFCHVPNGMRTTKAQAGIFKAMGMQAGAPDLIIWMKGATLQIELKAGKGKLSDAQKAFGARLTALGHSYHVITAETPSDAVTQLERLLACSVTVETT